MRKGVMGFKVVEEVGVGGVKLGVASSAPLPPPPPPPDMFLQGPASSWTMSAFTVTTLVYCTHG